MSALFFAVLLAGDPVNFRDDISQEEYVKFLNADANPRLEFDCRLYDEAGVAYSVSFVQSGGYALLEGGFKQGVRNYTVGKSPTKTEVKIDETGVFQSVSMPPIYDASIARETVRFRTDDGNTLTTIEHMESATSGPIVVSAMTTPPPMVSQRSDSAEESNRHKAQIYDPRPSQLAGFCSVDQQRQPELTFDDFERLAREAP